MSYSDHEREHIPFLTAVVAVIASSLFRAPWFGLLLLMPATTSGVAVFCLVLVSAGVLLLHWCLGWLGWQIPFRAALAARALPAAVAASTTGAFGLRSSLPILIAMIVLEFLLAVGVVATTAERVLGDHGLTGFEKGELLPRHPDDDLPAEERYERDVASLVREAREARFRPSPRSSY